jgi:hypothetical protein
MAKQTTILFLLLLCVTISLRATVPHLSVYHEEVDLGDDGSARVTLRLTLPEGSDAVLSIPVRHRALTDLRPLGPDPLRLRSEERQGTLFLVVEIPRSPDGPRTIGLSYTVKDYFEPGGSAAAFGGRDLAYRFVNVNFEGIETFSAQLKLPRGWVFHDIGRFLPKPRKTGAAPPYKLARDGDRRTITLSLSRLGLGDEVALDCTFRSQGRSWAVALFLILVALAYLFFFRDILKNGRKPSGEGQ